MSIADKLIKIANNSPMVYDAGYENGRGAGFDEGFEVGYGDGHSAGEEVGLAAGKQAEYDRFWDVFQSNGELMNFQNVFNNQAWTDEIYNPKYPIFSSTGGSIFANSSITDTKVAIDISAATSAASLFSWSRVKNVRRLIVSDKVTFANAFYNAQQLISIVFEGTIGQDINFQWSAKLSRASIENIVSCLSKTVSGMTLTVSNTAVMNAFTEEEWETLIADYTNWTISRV